MIRVHITYTGAVSRIVLHLLVDYHLGETKIRYFYHICHYSKSTVFADEDILGFYIAMEDALFVQVLDSFSNLENNGNCLLLLNRSLLLEDGLEIAELVENGTLESRIRERSICCWKSPRSP